MCREKKMKTADFYRESDHKEHYEVLERFMKINGLWPYQSMSAKCLFGIITMILTEGITVGEIWKVIELWPDLKEVFNCVPNLVISFFIASEYLGILCNSDKLKKCIDRIAEDWTYMTSDEEMNVLRLYTLQGRKLAKTYFVYMTITGFMFILQPFVVTLTSISDNSTDLVESTIPYRVQYGIDMEKNYYMILVICYISVVAHMGILCSLNLIYISLVQHNCGLFSIIGYNLGHLGENESLTTDPNIEKKHDKNYWIALECLRKHVKAIEFSECVKETFSASFLCTLGLHVLGLALSGTQVILSFDDINEAVRYFCLGLSILIQLLWQCWQAQLLLDYSNIPYECAVEARWYKTSIRCNKILILIMLRSSRPCVITAGKTIVMSIETFSSVLRTSMSYFTMLQSVQ